MAERQFLELFGFLMAQEFSIAAPKDTGNLARSFTGTFRIVNDDTISYTLPEYAAYVEFGTRPHKITPKNMQALKFKSKSSGDNYVIVKSVMHPGTKANPFIRDTFNRKAENVLKQTVKILMEED